MYMTGCSDSVRCEPVEVEIDEVDATRGECKCPFCSGKFKVIVRDSGSAGNSVHCKRCGFDWIARKGTPMKCPRCGSYSWNKETRRCTCRICGHEWVRRKDGKNPSRCPNCNSNRWNEPPKTVEKKITSEDPNAVRNRWIVERYENGEGCLAIASELGIPLMRVMKVITEKFSLDVMPRI